jgi:hypothetical protein
MSQKIGTKQERKRRGETKGDKNQIEKWEMTIKRSQKSEKGRKKTWQKAIKYKKPKIKILTHELLASTLSYLMLPPY